MMAASRAPLSRRTFAGVLTAALIALFLVAGWAPFHSPRNGVSWLQNGEGLQLRRPATLWSAKELATPGAVLRTIEILLQPDRTDEGGTILAFQTKRAEHFYLNQSQSHLELQWPGRGARRNHVYIGDVFQRGRTVLITVVSGGDGVAVYIDGALKRKTNRGFRFSESDLAGRLIVGASPFSSYAWGGELRGLALSGREYGPGDVRQRFAAWTTMGRPAAGAEPLALYLFADGTGPFVRDHGSLHWDFAIPPRFAVLHQTLLEPFWRDFTSRLNWGFWSDVLLNICGFLPFGILLCAYLTEAGRSRQAAFWTTLLCGFVVSLVIESVQVFLPTRCSDSRDLLTNSLGTLFGVAVYQCRPLRSLYERCADLFLDRWNELRTRSAAQPAPSSASEARGVAAN